jgi:hypothetical protein
MLEFKIIVFSVVVSFAYSIMIRQGELLQVWARLLNGWNDREQSFISGLVTKLFLCPYCFAGQLSMYSCFFLLFDNKGGFELFISVPFSIVIMWFLSNEYLKQ